MLLARSGMREGEVAVIVAILLIVVIAILLVVVIAILLIVIITRVQDTSAGSRA